jgi:hypothetical protein
MSEDVRTIMLEGMRARHPGATEDELHKLMLRRIYGDAWDRLVPEL